MAHPTEKHRKKTPASQLHAAVSPTVIGLSAGMGVISPEDTRSVTLAFTALLLTGLLIHMIRLRRKLEQANTVSTNCRLRLNALENNLPEAVMFQLVHHADRTFEFSFMGEGYARMLGFNREALMKDARLALEHIYEKDMQLLRDAFRLGKKESKTACFELRVLDQRGKLRWLQVYAAPRMGQRALYWDGFFLDVSAAKRQLAALRDEKQNLQNIFEVIEDLIFICDSEGRIMHANSATQHRMQTALSDLQNKSIFEFVTENSRNSIYKLIATMQTHDQAAAEITVIGGGADEVIIGEMRAYRGEWEQKEAIYIQLRDITKQKTEERSLKESQEVLQHIINTIPMSVYWKDTQSTYHGCNKTFAKAHGLDETDGIVGKTSYDLHEDDLAREIEQQEQQAIQTNRAVEQLRKPYIREDGSPGRRDISTLPLHGENGLPVGVLGIWRDVTETSLAEERLKRTLDDMERFNDLLRSRERRTLELKAEINTLLIQNGQEPKYQTTLEGRE